MSYHISFDVDFRRNPYTGKYIAIEGIDGSGKSTQVEKLKEYFTESNKNVIITHEPQSDDLIGKIIRDAIQSKISIPSTALQYLYSADRVINHHTVVEPSLQKGAIVLSHRVFWSAIPYGVLDKTLDTNGEYIYSEHQQILIAQGLLSMYHQFIVPDYTFFLDISVDTAMQRLSRMNKTKEIYEKKDKLEKIRKGYHMLLKEFPKEFIIINGEQTAEDVTKEIISHL